MNDNAISKFPRAKYTASPVDQRKCEKEPKSITQWTPTCSSILLGQQRFGHLENLSYVNKRKRNLKMTNMPPILMIFKILLVRAWIFWILPASSWTFKILPTLNLHILPPGNRAGKILKFQNLEILLTRSKIQTMDSVRWISCNTQWLRTDKVGHLSRSNSSSLDVG